MEKKKRIKLKVERERKTEVWRCCIHVQIELRHKLQFFREREKLPEGWQDPGDSGCSCLVCLTPVTFVT